MKCKVFADHYSAGFLITLWSHHISFDKLLPIWDYYIITNSPVFHIFTVVAYILQFRDDLLANEKEEDIFSILTHLPQPNVKQLICDAKNIMNNTPTSFISTLCNMILGKTNATEESLAQLNCSLCLYITPQELLTSCFRDSQYSSQSIKHSILGKSQNFIHYTIVDIRSEEEYIMSHIKGSRLLSSSLFEDVERLIAELPNEQSDEYKRHIVLITNSIQHNNLAKYLYKKNSKSLLTVATQAEVINASVEENNDLLVLQQFTCLFFQRGYHYVSYCDGGYKAIQELCSTLPKEQYQYVFVETEKKEGNDFSIRLMDENR